MIQRIQSVYLFLTTVISVLFLSGNIIEFHSAGNFIVLNAFNINKVIETGTEHIQSVLPYTALVFIIPLLSFAAIFLYKIRRTQLRLVLFLIVLTLAEIAATAFYYFNIGNTYNAEPVFSIKIILPVVILIQEVLAYSGIKKDENIVRSYDRLR